MNAYIVVVENDKGQQQGHHIFSSRAKADEFLKTFSTSQKVRVVEREAVPEALNRVAAQGR
jgi:hypothetical protein